MLISKRRSEDSIGENLSYQELGKAFLDMIPKI